MISSRAWKGKQGLADEIRRLMFIFEDLLQVDDRSLMALLKEINSESLKVALKTASEELKPFALQLWHSVEAWRGDCEATTWIYRVALNTALAWRRKERRHREGRQDIEDATGLLIAPSGRDPRLDWIYQRIAELDEANRALALLMLDGFSYRDMSQILGLSESNVGVKINRIKAALAAQLAKEEHDGL